MKVLNRKNDIDLTRLDEVGVAVATDKLFIEKVSGSERRKWISFTNLSASIGSALVSAIVPTGIMTPWLTGVAPTGWVLASGGTIGNVASGATTRASADTAALYSVLWQAFSNTAIPIQTSSGVATTRGTSAADDFASNKRLPLPDLRGRGVRGVDVDPVGTTGGSSTVTLLATNLPPHTHTTATTTSTPASASAGVDVASVGAAIPITSSDGPGASESFSILNPFISLPFIIKL